MEIGKKLKEARLNRDLTQEVIAEKLNVSRQIICHKNSLEKDFMLQDRQFPIGKMKNLILIL